MRNGPLKSGTNQALTNELFCEINLGKYKPSYTVKSEDLEKDGIVYPSLKRLYLESLDPTEARFVEVAFDGNRRQWERIKASKSIAPFFIKGSGRELAWHEEWARELEIKLRSKGIRAIIKEVEEDGRSAYSAAKWLAEGNWKPQRGRPSKDDIARERAVAADALTDAETDWDRMEDIEKNWNVIEGGVKD